MNLSDIFLEEPKETKRFAIKEMSEVKFIDVTTGKTILELDPVSVEVTTEDERSKHMRMASKATVSFSNITKETRQESFEKVTATLGDRQRVVMEHLKTTFENGATAKELSNHLYAIGLAASPERNSVHPRLNELIEQGLVEVVGKKTCQFTNRKVAIYKSKI